MSQTPEAAFKQALRLVGREVELREMARVLELVPVHHQDAVALFTMASRLRLERLTLLEQAGLLP